ncbi:MAG: HD domain-containing protein [Bryobacteraceae bacterium]|nr:HD domain-containing protein [Bryobacteraceae bacterium]
MTVGEKGREPNINGALIHSIPLLDELLTVYARELGGDFTAYRNHTYRVANFCAALSASGQEQLERIAVAAAFHDLGIWTEGTFDYVAPSIELARAYLLKTGKAEQSPEISEMILEHHKIRATHSQPGWLVEPFRRADWVDVSMGFFTAGLSRKVVNDAYAVWPSAGFHKHLIQLFARRMQDHPLSPLPMMRF